MVLVRGRLNDTQTTGLCVRIAAAVAAVFVVAATAAAQPSPCPEALSEAQQRYQDGAFEAVAGLLSPCLDRPDRTDEEATFAYRLLALTAIRQDRIEEARLAALNLLNLDPLYAADAVLDPPAYVALIETVRRQLGLPLPGEDPPPPLVPDTLVADTVSAPPPPLPAPPRASRFQVQYWGGASSYGGERGNSATTRAREFAENAGPATGLGLVYTLGAGVALAGEVGLGLYPSKGQAVNDDLDANPSTWLVDATASVQALAMPSWPASPYARAGVTVVASEVNGVGRLGGGPVAALGVEVDLGGRYRIYAEGGGTLILPGSASDGVSTSGGGDFFTHVRAGFRYRLLRR